MKKYFDISISLFICVFLMFGSVHVGLGQTTLAAGDIAILGINCDDPDDFAFLMLKDITTGTIINFTDDGWFAAGGFRNTEGIIAYTSSGPVAAGNVITYSTSSSNFTTVSGSFFFAASGDQLIAFQGDVSSPTLIFAVNDDGAATWQADATSSNNSALPTGLTNGETAVALTERDNVKYNGSTSFSSPSNALAAIANNSNWTGDDATRYDLTTFGDFSLPVELTRFEAISNNGAVNLNWVTESEIENLGFLIYRKAVGERFELLDSYRSNDNLKGQGSVTYRTDYNYTDEKVRVGQTYSYQLSDVDYTGKETRHDLVSVTVRSRGVRMKSAYPNPFNPSTTFTVVLGEPTQLRVSIFNLLGQEVQRLMDKHQPEGEYTISWNGRDQNGNNLPSGLYFIELQSGSTLQVQKAVLVR